MWGWLGRAGRVLPGVDDPLADFPNLKRLYDKIDARPAAARAKAVGKDHAFKKDVDEQTKAGDVPVELPRDRDVSKLGSALTVSRTEPVEPWRREFFCRRVADEFSTLY